jgi:tetratricopeptide (TPR) repeat protein
MSEWRRVGIIAACFMIVAGVVILVDHALSPRLPGQASSGSITLPRAQLIEQQLDQAASLNNSGNVLSALKLYDKILTEDPDDPQALAASGWLDWNFGTEGDSPTLTAQGRQDEEKAVRDAPSFFGGHLFLGLILLNEDHNAKAAVLQFNDFLADGPSIDEVQTVAADLRVAYVDAGVPVPPALAAPSG